MSLLRNMDVGEIGECRGVGWVDVLNVTKNMDGLGNNGGSNLYHEVSLGENAVAGVPTGSLDAPPCQLDNLQHRQHIHVLRRRHRFNGS